MPTEECEKELAALREWVIRLSRMRTTPEAFRDERVFKLVKTKAQEIEAERADDET